MKFHALQHRVHRHERLVEARAQQLGAHWGALKGNWREAWTPWRIVSVGLVAGFLTGRAEPLRALTGPRLMQMIGAVSSLFATMQAAVAEPAAATAGDKPAPAAPIADPADDAGQPVAAPRPAEAATDVSER